MKRLILATFLAGFLAGCFQAPVKVPMPEPAVNNEMSKKAEEREARYRKRRPIPTSQARYEGSLWRDESSWGNLLRDHRARFKNDVVTITNVSAIANAPEPLPAKMEPTTAPTTPGGEAQPQAQQLAAAATKAQATNEAMRILSGEEEQNQILRSLQTISARVVGVYPNGNMLVKGEKIDHRQQNSIRYTTTVVGIVRPEDVTETNEVVSTKLARPEVKIRRQVLRRRVRATNVLPEKKQQKTGLFDRLGHMFSK